MSSTRVEAGGGATPGDSRTFVPQSEAGPVYSRFDTGAEDGWWGTAAS